MAIIYTNSDDGSYLLSKTGARLKGFAGFFGLATLDLLFVPNQTAGINIGLMGVLPMLLDAGIGI